MSAREAADIEGASRSKIAAYWLLVLLVFVSTLLIFLFEFRLQSVSALELVESGSRFSPNMSQLFAEGQDAQGESIFVWIFVASFLLLFARLLGFGIISSLVVFSAAFLVQHFELPVLRILYERSALATTAATGLFLVVAVKFIKSACKNETTFALRYLKKTAIFATIGAAILFVYSEVQGLEYAQTVSILRGGLLVAAVSFLAFELLRQFGNVLQLTAAAAVCFLVAFTGIPGILPGGSENDSINSESLMAKGEQAFELIVFAFKEEQFDVTSFLAALNERYGEVEMGKIDLRLLESPTLNSQGLSLDQLGAGLEDARALVFSERILESFKSAGSTLQAAGQDPKKTTIALDADSRARVDLHSLLALHTETPAGVLSDGQIELQDFMGKVRLNVGLASEILVLDQRGNLLELSQ